MKYRDDEDCIYANCLSLGYQMFAKLHPYLWEYLEEESAKFLDDQDLFDESIENKFYWKVTKYIEINTRIYELYEVTFSLRKELLSVHGYAYNFNRRLFRDSEDLKYFTEEQKFILSHAKQIETPQNVVLPYHPGDILYVDANPFGKPFYAVYCAETILEKEHFEWTKEEYGFYKREYPCLYISEDGKGLEVTDLTG